jgi:hypothetical protein
MRQTGSATNLYIDGILLGIAPIPGVPTIRRFAALIGEYMWSRTKISSDN